MKYLCACGCGEEVDVPNTYKEGHKTQKNSMKKEIRISQNTEPEKASEVADTVYDHPLVGKYCRLGNMSLAAMEYIGIASGSNVKITAFHPPDNSVNICLAGGEKTAEYIPLSYLTNVTENLANYVDPNRINKSAQKGINMDDAVSESRFDNAPNVNKSTPMQTIPNRMGSAVIKGSMSNPANMQHKAPGRQERTSYRDYLKRASTGEQSDYCTENIGYISGSDEAEVQWIERELLAPVDKGANRNYSHEYTEEDPYANFNDTMAMRLENEKLNRMRDYGNMFSNTGACPVCFEPDNISIESPPDTNDVVHCLCGNCEVDFFAHIASVSDAAKSYREHSSRMPDSMDGAQLQTTMTGISIPDNKKYELIEINNELEEINRQLAMLED